MARASAVCKSATMGMGRSSTSCAFKWGFVLQNARLRTVRHAALSAVVTWLASFGRRSIHDAGREFRLCRCIGFLHCLFVIPATFVNGWSHPLFNINLLTCFACGEAL